MTPTWTQLTANMEADLYQVGDAVEYDVTITNNGTVDAVLSDVLGTPSNSNAIIVTFSGYSIGEVLYKNGQSGNTKTIHVRIEYNPAYTGGPTSGEASVEFVYVQDDGSIVVPDVQTVYALNTNTVYKNTSTLQNVGTTYGSCLTTGKYACLKYAIEGNVITGAWACFVINGTEHCLQGLVDECDFDPELDDGDGACAYAGTPILIMDVGMVVHILLCQIVMRICMRF